MQDQGEAPPVSEPEKEPESTQPEAQPNFLQKLLSLFRGKPKE